MDVINSLYDLGNFFTSMGNKFQDTDEILKQMAQQITDLQG